MTRGEEPAAGLVMRNLHMGPTLVRLEPRHPLTCLKADAQGGTCDVFGG